MPLDQNQFQISDLHSSLLDTSNGDKLVEFLKRKRGISSNKRLFPITSSPRYSFPLPLEAKNITKSKFETPLAASTPATSLELNTERNKHAKQNIEQFSTDNPENIDSQEQTLKANDAENSSLEKENVHKTITSNKTALGNSISKHKKKENKQAENIDKPIEVIQNNGHPNKNQSHKQVCNTGLESSLLSISKSKVVLNRLQTHKYITKEASAQNKENSDTTPNGVIDANQIKPKNLSQQINVEIKRQHDHNGKVSSKPNLTCKTSNKNTSSEIPMVTIPSNQNIRESKHGSNTNDEQHKTNAIFPENFNILSPEQINKSIAENEIVAEEYIVTPEDDVVNETEDLQIVEESVDDESIDLIISNPINHLNNENAEVYNEKEIIPYCQNECNIQTSLGRKSVSCDSNLESLHFSDSDSNFNENLVEPPVNNDAFNNKYKNEFVRDLTPETGLKLFNKMLKNKNPRKSVKTRQGDPNNQNMESLKRSYLNVEQILKETKKSHNEISRRKLYSKGKSDIESDADSIVSSTQDSRPSEESKSTKRKVSTLKPTNDSKLSQQNVKKNNTKSKIFCETISDNNIHQLSTINNILSDWQDENETPNTVTNSNNQNVKNVDSVFRYPQVPKPKASKKQNKVKTSMKKKNSSVHEKSCPEEELKLKKVDDQTNKNLTLKSSPEVSTSIQLQTKQARNNTKKHENKINDTIGRHHQQNEELSKTNTDKKITRKSKHTINMTASNSENYHIPNIEANHSFTSINNNEIDTVSMKIIETSEPIIPIKKSRKEKGIHNTEKIKQYPISKKKENKESSVEHPKTTNKDQNASTSSNNVEPNAKKEKLSQKTTNQKHENKINDTIGRHHQQNEELSKTNTDKKITRKSKQTINMTASNSENYHIPNIEANHSFTSINNNEIDTVSMKIIETSEPIIPVKKSRNEKGIHNTEKIKQNPISKKKKNKESCVEHPKTTNKDQNASTSSNNVEPNAKKEKLSQKTTKLPQEDLENASEDSGVRRSKRTRRPPGVYWSSRQGTLNDDYLTKAYKEAFEIKLKTKTKRKPKLKTVKSSETNIIPNEHHFDEIKNGPIYNIQNNKRKSPSKNQEKETKTKKSKIHKDKILKEQPQPNVTIKNVSESFRTQDLPHLLLEGMNDTNQISTVSPTDERPTIDIDQNKSPQLNSDSGNASANIQQDPNPNIDGALLDWLKHFPPSNSDLSKPDICKFVQFPENIRLASLSDLVIRKIHGVEYAYYSDRNNPSEYNYGYMKFQPKSSKQTSKTKLFQLKFLILIGHLEIKFSTHAVILKMGDLITIPKDVQYKFANRTDVPALLFFIKH